MRTQTLPSQESSGVEILVADLTIRLAPGFCLDTLAQPSLSYHAEGIRRRTTLALGRNSFQYCMVPSRAYCSRAVWPVIVGTTALDWSHTGQGKTLTQTRDYG